MKWKIILLCLMIITATAVMPVGAEEPVIGLGARYGSFGVPDKLVDRLVDEHPSISGSISGLEIRYYGGGGSRGALSVGLTVDYGYTKAEGIWRKESWDEAVYAEGELNMLAATITGYWDIFATSPIHPFIGIGFGFAYVEGSYEEDAGTVNISEGIPAVHLPAGLAVHLGDNLTLRAEARIINAFSFGGQLMVNF